MSEGVAARVVRLARAGEHTEYGISRECGIGHLAVRRILRQHGITLSRGSTPGVSRGHIAAALTERDAGQRLVVPTLAEKLEAAVPGATLRDDGQGEQRWSVRRGARALATGGSAHEAVDRACFLWGRR